MFFTKPKIDLKMITEMNFTSKTKIKQYAILLAKGDIKYASEIYDFLIKDLDELPAEDPAPATTMDRIKDTVTGGVSWLKENEDTLVNTFEHIRGLIQNVRGGGKPVSTAAPLKPIN